MDPSSSKEQNTQDQVELLEITSCEFQSSEVGCLPVPAAVKAGPNAIVNATSEDSSKTTAKAADRRIDSPNRKTSMPPTTNGTATCDASATRRRAMTALGAPTTAVFAGHNRNHGYVNSCMEAGAQSLNAAGDPSMYLPGIASQGSQPHAAGVATSVPNYGNSRSRDDTGLPRKPLPSVDGAQMAEELPGVEAVTA